MTTSGRFVHVVADRNRTEAGSKTLRGRTVLKSLPSVGVRRVIKFEDGTDLINLSTSGLAFANLTVGEQNGEAVITVTDQPGVGSITLTGVPQAAITEADFAFT
jgi:hypothetical protein